MSIHTPGRHRADSPAGWQPIGLPQPTVVAPAALKRPQTHASLRRTIRQIAGPTAALTASVAIMSVAAVTPSAQGATPVSTLLATDSPNAVDPNLDSATPTTTAQPTGPNAPQAHPVTAQANPPQANSIKAEQPNSLLPALPDVGSAIPNINGDTSGNHWTPGQPSAAAGASYGQPSSQVTLPTRNTDGKDVYLGDPSSRTFNGSDGGWAGYQEYSPWCWSRGATCVNWNFKHVDSGGPAGAGDGFLRVNGTSLGVAPCVPNTGVGRWVSPMFTYNTSNAKDWKIDFDFKTTALVAGDGHATFSIQVLDDQGRVVTTAHGPHAVLPTNHWGHFSNGFDGSKLVYGKNYRLSIMVDVVHAETALTWGNLDFDNIEMTATPGQPDGNGPDNDGSDPSQKSDDTVPYQVCRPARDLASAMTQLIASRPEDFCPVSNATGQAAAPLLDIADKVMKTPSVSNLIDKGSGAFAVLDLQTADFVGYAIGRDAMPSTDPRDLVAYIKDGGIGEAGNYALVFVTDAASMAPALAKNPVGSLTDIVTGQVQNGMELLSDPGRLTRIPLDWQVGNAKWMLETIVNPLVSKDQRDTEIGGTVWSDDDTDGKLDPTERGVPGVKVQLTDRNGNSYGTAVTGQDGRYVFTHLTPRTDPSDYYITFEPDSLPGDSTFTTEHAPGTVHGNTSHADPQTGKTDRIRISRYQEDLNWNAGLVNVPADNLGNVPGSDAPGTPSSSGSPIDVIGGLLGGGLPLPGSGQPGGSSGQPGSDPVGGLTGSLGGLLGGNLPLPGSGEGGSDPVGGLTGSLGGLLGGSLPLPGSTQPGSDQPGSNQPGSNQPGDNSDQPGSNPLGGLTGSLGGLLGGSLPLPGSTQPGSDQPGSDQPGSDQPGSDQPGDNSDQPGDNSGQPGSNPLGGLGGVLGGSLPLPGSTQPGSDQPGSDPVGGLTGSLGGLLGGSLPLPGSTQPGSDQPGSDQPGSDQPGSDQPGDNSGQPGDNSGQSGSNPLGGLGGVLGGSLPLPGSGEGGSDPLGGLTDTVGGLLGGSLPLPGSDQPGSDQPGSDQPGSDQPGSDQPGSDQPGSDQPGSDQPGSDQPGSGQPGSDQPGSGQPGSGQPGSTQPGSTQPGDTSGQPGSGQPGSTQPGSDQPGDTSGQPGSGQPGGEPGGQTDPNQPNQPNQPTEDTVNFSVGSPTVSDTPAHQAPGAKVQPGATITVAVPVTNTGSTPISDIKAQIPGENGLTDMKCSSAVLQPGATALCKVQTTAQQGNVKMTLNIIATTDDGQQMTKLCRVYYSAQPQGTGQIGLTGKATFNGRSIQVAGQSPLSTSDPATLTIEVVNTGNAPVTSLSGTSPIGQMSCASTALAPGQKTTCQITFTPKPGTNSMAVHIAGQDEAGNTSTASYNFTYGASLTDNSVQGQS